MTWDEFYRECVYIPYIELPDTPIITASNVTNGTIDFDYRKEVEKNFLYDIPIDFEYDDGVVS